MSRKLSVESSHDRSIIKV